MAWRIVLVTLSDTMFFFVLQQDYSIAAKNGCKRSKLETSGW